ncbi:hypothetical protein HY212_05375 [Candidatus Pacearchaeota archaeon]|nr:hypothetical protein [Candidatus Pacearchaeota archaeon]
MVKKSDLELVEKRNLQLGNGSYVNAQLYKNAQGCYFAWYKPEFIDSSHFQLQGPITLNGNGTSKLRRKIEKDLVFRARYNERSII